jgi:mono/diheme cytochrome c family protein
MASSQAAGTTKNPLAGSSQGIQRGRIAYTGSCAVCHGATGDGRGAFGVELYPPASNLQQPTTQGKTDAELFWIVKNGLSFLGMPGYGDRYEDTDIWSIVAYLRTLPNADHRPAQVPPPVTDAQLAIANPAGDAAARGAGVYYAQGCNLCHGAIGNGQGNLQLHGAGDAADIVRRGRRGMPAYNTTKITQAELADLIAYLRNLGKLQRG